MSGGGERTELEEAIAAQERLRGVVPDVVVDRSIAALRSALESFDETPAPSRRHVTILFADIRGFTAMSERLDAEQLADLMNRVWDLLDDVVRARDGRVDKHIGDAIMAVWGAKTAQEDDPEQAVRAALDMQAALRDVRDRDDLDIGMRIGINTGPALVGSVGTSGTEFTAMGDTVNVASRLEHAAPDDSVLISHGTYRHVRGVFDVRAPQRLPLRGKAEPVLAYVVDRAKPRAFRMPTRGVEGVETSTVGRSAELTALCAEFANSFDHDEFRLVTVVGEAGVGKSRLLYDFRHWLELQPASVYLLTGRAHLGQQGRAMSLFRDVVATRFEILQSDVPDVVVDKLREGFAPALTAQQADITGHWLGFELAANEAVARVAGSTELAAVGRAHLLTWLSGRLADNSGVLLLEDVHWADDDSLALVRHLAESSDLPLLVVSLARPVLLERVADWPVVGARVSRLDMRPLDTTSCGDLVREVLKQVDDLPDRLVRMIVERVDGNPFYVEEMVKMLIDDGIVRVADDGAWQVDDERLDASRVPVTLTGVLQARLDGLPSSERIALQRAAVVGRIFWDCALAALSIGDRPGATITVARQRELVQQRAPSTFTGCVELAFHHALLRDVAYETVLLRDRPALHALAAAWLEQAAGERVSEFREAIARHFELAGMSEAAAEQLWFAGEASARSGHHHAATRTLRRAFEMWDDCGATPPPRAYEVLGTSLRIVGDLDDAARLLQHGIETLEAGSPSAAELYYAASVVAAIRADRDAEGTLLDAARRCVRPDDAATLAAIEIGSAWWHLAWDRLDDCAAAASRALELAHGDARRSAEAEAALGVAAAEAGDLSAACDHCERERTYATESGNLYAVAAALGHLGVTNHLRGDNGETDCYADALDCYQQAQKLFEQLGAGPALDNLRANLCQLHLRLGDNDAARDGLRGLFSASSRDGSSLDFVVLHFQIEADRRITFGEVAGGLQLLGRLRRLATYSAIDEHECQRILSRVDLSDDELERHMDAGTGLDLSAVIDDVLS